MTHNPLNTTQITSVDTGVNSSRSMASNAEETNGFKMAAREQSAKDKCSILAYSCLEL